MLWLRFSMMSQKIFAIRPRRNKTLNISCCTKVIFFQRVISEKCCMPSNSCSSFTILIRTKLIKFSSLFSFTISMIKIALVDFKIFFFIGNERFQIWVNLTLWVLEHNFSSSMQITKGSQNSFRNNIIIRYHSYLS